MAADDGREFRNFFASRSTPISLRRAMRTPISPVPHCATTSSRRAISCSARPSCLMVVLLWSTAVTCRSTDTEQSPPGRGHADRLSALARAGVDCSSSIERLNADTWFVRDQRVDGGARGWGEVAPFYIDQEAPVPEGGLPSPVEAPGSRSVTTTFVYALTRFGLAAVLAEVLRSGCSAVAEGPPSSRIAAVSRLSHD